MSEVTVAVIQMQCTADVQTEYENSRTAGQAGGRAGRSGDSASGTVRAALFLPGTASMNITTTPLPTEDRIRRCVHMQSAGRVSWGVVLAHQLLRAGAEHLLYQPASLWWMQTAACWASTGRPTSRTTTSIRKNSTLPRETPASQVWDTRYGRIGIGICWDQWFPETASMPGPEGS